MGVITSAVLAVASIAGQAYSSIKQKREAKKSNRAARRAEAAQSRRGRVAAFRSQRINAAQAKGAAANSGAVAASSGLSGGLAAMSSNTSSNVTFATQLDQFRGQQLDAQAASQRAQFIGAAAQIPQQAAGAIREFAKS